MPGHALYGGGRETLLERLCIEHPKFFADHPNDKEVKCLVFDIETHSPDGRFPFGENYPIVAIGIVTSTGERKVCLLYTFDAADDLLCVVLGVSRYNTNTIHHLTRL